MADTEKTEIEIEIDNYKAAVDTAIGTLSSKREASTDALAQGNSPGGTVNPKKHGKGVTCGSAKLNSVSWLDGDHIAVAAQDGITIIFNAKATSSAMRYDHMISSWINTTEFNQHTAGSNQSMLAMGGLDNMITVIDIDHQKLMAQEALDESDSAKNIRKFEKHQGPIYCVKWIDKTKFLSGSGDNKILLWDTHECKKLEKTPKQTFSGHNGDVCDISIMDDNTFLTASGDSYCKMWDVRAGDSTATFIGHTMSVTGIRQIGNTHGFVSVSEDSTLRVWDARTAKQVLMVGEEMDPEEKQEEREASALELSESGRIAFMGFADGTLNQVDLMTGKVLRPLKHHAHRITCIARSPDGFAVASCSRSEEQKNNFAIWA